MTSNEVIAMQRLEIAQLKTKVENLTQKKVKLKQQNKKLKDKIYNYKLCKNITEPFNEINKMKLEKLEKIIEIIKTKTIVIVALQLSKDLSDYNRMTHFDNLTQEEYDLLKGVF